MTWVLSNPTTHKVGHAQEATIQKIRRYIQEQAKPGPKGIQFLHEFVSDGVTGAPRPLNRKQINYQIGRWESAYKDLTEELRKNAWFMDGSSNGTKRWRAVAYNPATQTCLVLEDTQGSSQLAELAVAWQAIDATPAGQVCYLFTDSWAVAQGLVKWLDKWQQDDYRIRTKEIWGREFWQKIWDALCTRMIQVVNATLATPLQSTFRDWNGMQNWNMWCSHVGQTPVLPPQELNLLGTLLKSAVCT